MAPQLGASLDSGCGQGWQSNQFGSLNEIFVNWLCLYQSRLGGTAHYFQRLRSILWMILADIIPCHISNSSAYCNRHPFLKLSGGKDQQKALYLKGMGPHSEG